MRSAIGARRTSVRIVQSSARRRGGERRAFDYRRASSYLALMAGSVAFDTLKFVEKLEAAGVSSVHAKATAEAFAEATSQELATKTDLIAVKTELKADIASVRTELKADIASVRTELKADIASVRTELKAEIASVRSDLSAQIASVQSDLSAEIASVQSSLGSEIASVRSEVELVKRDLKIWFGSVMVVAVGIILAAIRYLPPGHP
jgi:hypothetical protein